LADEGQEPGCQGVGNGQCNKNEEEQWGEYNVGQNASMLHQDLYVS
jgi:hypothetical protein